MAHIASHGYIVVNSWRILGAVTNYTVKMENFANTLSWCSEHCQNNLRNSDDIPDSIVLDFENTFGKVENK